MNALLLLGVFLFFGFWAWLDDTFGVGPRKSEGIEAKIERQRGAPVRRSFFQR